MFKKEAKKYAVNTRTQKEIKVLNTVQYWGSESLSPEERHLWEGMEDREVAREQGFKDGAEFGYNKAKEDADKMKSQFLELCNLKDMRIAELNKANEWHYVKNGVLPKDKEYVLIYTDLNNCYVATKVENHFMSKGWGFIPMSTVIAWKEIVLPELPKESK